MRPYKFTLNESNGFWIDLDSVLAIHDPFIPSRDAILKEHPDMHKYYPAFSCSIVLMFQDKPKTIEWHDLESIDRMVNEHAKLVAAWKKTK